ncbi:MAG: hypothetical protein ACE5LS_05385 [Thermoplasmata archaeon]
MRILHVQNLANIAVYLRDAQRELGHESVVASVWDRANYLNYPEDWRFFRGEDILDKATFFATLFSLVHWAEVVHLHGAFGWRRLLRLMRHMGKTIILHFHGMGNLGRRLGSLAHATLLATPDLKRHCPRGIYLPNAFAPLDPAPPRRQNGTFRVVHAHTLREDLEAVKGTETIRRVVSRIPGAELVEVAGRTHDEALRIYASCDLAVDQLRIGWYGAFALECMSLGIPTLGYVDESHGSGNPVHPVNDRILGETIAAFMDDKALRRRVAEKQRKFVIEVHDPVTIARRVLDIYEDSAAGFDD